MFTKAPFLLVVLRIFLMENVQHVVTKKKKIIKKNLFIFKSFNMQETEIKMVNIAGFVVYMEFG